MSLTNQNKDIPDFFFLNQSGKIGVEELGKNEESEQLVAY